MNGVDRPYIEKLKLLDFDNPADIETAHVEADKVLCELLLKLGYDEIVEEYKKVPKWYS